jgi:hypothetical protein
VAVLVGSAASSDVGCSATKPTEIVPGALTQVQVPVDLAAIQVEVYANGAQKFCEPYQVADGEVELPSTLGLISGAPNTTLRVIIRGYDQASSTSPDIQLCGGLPVDAPPSANQNQGPGPRVLRQAVVTYVDQQTLFLPMLLSFSCYDVDCTMQGTDSTCQGGQCVDDHVTSMAPFTPSLVDGTGDCFNLDQCFPAGVSAVSIDPANCIYGVPQMLQGGSNLNVRVFYQQMTWTQDPGTGLYSVQAGVPTEQEILNQDATEGFTIPDPTNPQQFQLAKGLCNLVQAQTTPTKPQPASGTASFPAISDVQVATTCQPKLPLLPFCAGQQHGNVTTATTVQDACGTAIPLEPTPSAVYMVMDDSGAMFGAYGQTGYATAMNLAFAFPVFKHTYVAFDYLTHSVGECPPSTGTTAYGTPAVDFGLSGTVEKDVAPFLVNWQAKDSPMTPSPLYLEAAMRLDQGAYKHVLDFSKRLSPDSGSKGPLNVAAVMFFVNRIPEVMPVVDAGTGGGSDYPSQGQECTPTSGTVQSTLVAQAQAAASAGLRTYFVVLNDKQMDGPNQLAYYQSLATMAGGSGSTAPLQVLDATSSVQSQVLANFQTAITSVATCSYQTPPGITTAGTLSFTVPVGIPVFNPTTAPRAIPIAQSSSCNAASIGDNTLNAWNIDSTTGRIVLCGQACANLQGAIGAVAAVALEKENGDAGADAGPPALPDGGVVVPDVPVTVSMPCDDAGL